MTRFLQIFFLYIFGFNTINAQNLSLPEFNEFHNTNAAALAFPVQKLQLNWNTNTSSWDSTSLWNYTYNSNDQLMELYSTLFISNSWENQQKEIHHYNSQAKDSVINFYGWSSVENQYQFLGNYLFKYNSINKVDSLIFLLNNNGTLSWQLSVKYYYNLSEQLVAFAKQQKISSALVYTDSSSFTYNLSNQLVSEERYVYNTSSSSWMKKELINKNYNASEVESEITSEWNVTTSQYDSLQIKTLTYNSGMLSGILNLMKSTNWDTINRVTLIYNSSNELETELTEVYLNNGWVNSKMIIYNPNLGVWIKENKLILVNVFPNPASENLYISSTEFINELSVLNVNGQLVKYLTAFENNKHSVDVSDLKSGLYILQYKVKNRINYSKFIVR